jgi:hypothetical protein
MSEKPEVPMVHFYHGQRVDEMSREDLIRAVIWLGEWNRTLTQGAQQDREMFGRIMKSARPR